LKCFKNLLVDPWTVCRVGPGKKNCDRCNKQSESCDLVSPSPSPLKVADSFFKIDSALPLGGLPGVGRHCHDLQGMA
jgi:hypothetical protein